MAPIRSSAEAAMICCLAARRRFALWRLQGFDRVSYEDSSVAVRASLTAGKGKMGDAEGDEYTGVGPYRHKL